MNAHDGCNHKTHKAWNPKSNGSGSASYYQRGPATKQSVFRPNQGVEHFFKAKQPSGAKTSANKAYNKGQNFETAAEKFEKFSLPTEESTKSDSNNDSPQQHKYQSMVVVKSAEKLISLESSPNQEDDE